jgi:hypothetical protein
VPWLFVINSSTALEWVLTERRMAFRAGVATSRLHVGDLWAIYATRRALPREESGQVVATGEVVSPVQPGIVTVAGVEYANSCALKVQVAVPGGNGVPIKPLVERLRFIVYKDGWAGYLRRSMVEIKPTDFELFVSELERRM